MKSSCRQEFFSSEKNVAQKCMKITVMAQYLLYSNIKVADLMCHLSFSNKARCVLHAKDQHSLCIRALFSFQTDGYNYMFFYH